LPGPYITSRTIICHWAFRNQQIHTYMTRARLKPEGIDRILRNLALPLVTLFAASAPSIANAQFVDTAHCRLFTALANIYSVPAAGGITVSGPNTQESLLPTDGGDCLASPGPVPAPGTDASWYTVTAIINFDNPPFQTWWTYSVTAQPNTTNAYRYGEISIFAAYGVTVLDDFYQPPCLPSSCDLPVSIIKPNAGPLPNVQVPSGVSGSGPAYNAGNGVQFAATGGSGTYRWSATGAPQGLTIDANTGLLLGAPTAALVVSGGASSYAPDTYSMTVTVSDTGQPPQTASLQYTLSSYCGNPTGAPPGDARDMLAQEYAFQGVQLHPGTQGPGIYSNGQYAWCTDFTQSHPELNVSIKCAADQSSWEVVQSNLPDSLLTWEVASGVGANNLTSAYRTPNTQIECIKSVAHGYHMSGAAVDLNTGCSSTDPICLATYEKLDFWAIKTGFDWTETYQKGLMQCQPGRQACVHGDRRNHPSPFINP
jgi:hypothetical protein